MRHYNTLPRAYIYRQKVLVHPYIVIPNVTLIFACSFSSLFVCFSGHLQDITAVHLLAQMFTDYFVAAWSSVSVLCFFAGQLSNRMTFDLVSGRGGLV